VDVIQNNPSNSLRNSSQAWSIDFPPFPSILAFCCLAVVALRGTNFVDVPATDEEEVGIFGPIAGCWTIDRPNLTAAGTKRVDSLAIFRIWGPDEITVWPAVGKFTFGFTTFLGMEILIRIKIKEIIFIFWKGFNGSVFFQTYKP
jgi:hypothetical protein